MSLHRFKPLPSGRMGVLWTLSPIRHAALIEFGCMGHMLYSNVTLKRSGVSQGASLFSTHITESDIALGDTGRLKKVLSQVVAKENPAVIFLTPSSVPETIGLDIHALAEELAPLFPHVQIFSLPCGGLDKVKHQGVEQTLSFLAEKLPESTPKSPTPTFNLIGSCPDLFRFQEDQREILRLLQGAFNLSAQCILTADTDIEKIKQMGKAHINIVLRQEGKAAAKILQKKFGTPYYVGRPYGIAGTEKWLLEIAPILDMPLNASFVAAEKKEAYQKISPALPHFRRMVRSFPKAARLSLGGHADVVAGILSFGQNEFSFSKGDCWCDCPYMANEEIPYGPEQYWAPLLQSHKKGILMASGEALSWAGKNMALQIANPDVLWRLSPYGAPLVGFHGAVHLTQLWVNESQLD